MEGFLALMIPIIALLIPIVAIMSQHQQKMATLLRGSTSDAEIQQLRMEIQQLKDLVNQQALVMDNLNTTLVRRQEIPPAPVMQERV